MERVVRTASLRSMDLMLRIVHHASPWARSRRSVIENPWRRIQASCLPMTSPRRPIASRGLAPIQALARWLGASPVTPNQISVASVGAAALVPLGLLAIGSWGGAILAIAGIQLRLLANVLDGLVAVEGGKSSPAGALYNEFPDRIADSLVLVAVGYAAGMPWLGWLAALLAALTAYVRLFGGSLGQPQSFRGPMAKQHRMAVVTVALAMAAGAQAWSRPDAAALALQAGLALVAAGSAWTCWTRTRAIVAQLPKDAA